MTPQQTWHHLPVHAPPPPGVTVPAQRQPSSAETLATMTVRGQGGRWGGRWVVVVLVATAAVLVLGTASGRSTATPAPADRAELPAPDPLRPGPCLPLCPGPPHR